MSKRLFLAVTLLLSTILAGCRAPARTPLVVFAAGSLIIPIDALAAGFEAAHPEIDVQPEYHGSIQVMRHATELHEAIDVVATADQSLIPLVMYGQSVPDTGEPYASWYITMGTNRLGIAYRPDSKYASEITPDNWYQVLARSDVRLGLSDPRFDAVGYRALMIYALAQEYYGDDAVFAAEFDGQFRYPVSLVDLGDRYIIKVPEILESSNDAHIAVRGSSVALISLLQAGEIDYAFEYESVIRQHGFEYLALPPELHLGDPALQAFYAGARVELGFHRFASVEPVFQGEQIKYAITIPVTSPHPDQAAAFIAYLFSEEGQAIMAANAHPLTVPPVADQPENVPEALRGLAAAP